MAVYFIRHNGHIKIGKSVDPWKRLASLQTAHHDPLEMLAIMPGSEDQEALAVEHGEMAESVRALLAAVQRLVAENARLAAEVRTLRAGRQVQIYGGYGYGIPEARAVALRDLAGEAGELNDMEAGE